MFKFGERGSTVGTALVALAAALPSAATGEVRLSYGKGEKVTLERCDGAGDCVTVYRDVGGEAAGRLPGMEFVRIGEGAFVMGSPEEEVGRDGDEGRVAVGLTRPFEMAATEVTQRQWVQVMGSNPSRFQEPEHCDNHATLGGVGMCPDHPVEGVSRDDVQGFLGRLNARSGAPGCEKGDRGEAPAGCHLLPTEAQWEYAARAGTETAYSFGDDPGDLKKYAVFDDDQTRRVRSRLPNPWGLHDMHGNVWEWTEDRYHEELPGGIDPLQDEPSSFRVLRGGSWSYGNARILRSANRSFDFPDNRNHGVGFRLMRTL